MAVALTSTSAPRPTRRPRGVPAGKTSLSDLPEKSSAATKKVALTEGEVKCEASTHLSAPTATPARPLDETVSTVKTGQSQPTKKEQQTTQQNQPETASASHSTTGDDPETVTESKAKSVTAQDKAEVPRRRESTRARKPSSRLLPSPSPPPPRSSSYYSHLKTTGVATAGHASGVATSSPPLAVAAKKVSITTAAPELPSGPVAQRTPPAASPVEDLSIDSSMSDAATGPGKRKRRPSMMTKPPATIAQASSDTSPSAGSARDQAAQSTTKSAKGRSSLKSATPEVRDDRKTSAPSVSKVARKVKKEIDNQKYPKSASSKALTVVHLSGYDSDGVYDRAMADEVANDEEESDAEDVIYSKMQGSDAKSSGSSIPLNPGSRVLKSGTLTVGAMRAAAQSSSSVLEPPPLISRRGGMKGSIGIHRQSSKQGVSSHLHHAAPPSGKHWTWNRSDVSVPLLRFKLDNLTPRADDEESSAAEEEDDFHVAMLEGGNFDAMSDMEDAEPCTASSVKSSPRVSKSYDGSDVEYTPATTPQSPQSTCDQADRRISGADDQSQHNQSNIAGGKHVVRDTVFAHALEPSSTRPHTHAGALTLSLPFNEMTHPSDDDPSAGAQTTAQSDHKALVEAKQSGMMADPHRGTASAADDGEHDEDSAMASDLLGTAADVSAIEPVEHRHGSAMILSSPNPGSTFASPNLPAARFHLAGSSRSEPAPLHLPPAVANKTANGKSSTLKSSTRFDSAHTSDEDSGDSDGDEHAFSQATLAMGLPESLCLSDLERAWEQSEYLNQARKTVGKVKGGDDDIAAHSEGGQSEEDVEQLALLSTAVSPKRRRRTDTKDVAEAAVEEEAASTPRLAKKARTPSSTIKTRQTAPGTPSPSNVRVARRSVRPRT